jgi:hypothetical protein
MSYTYYDVSDTCSGTATQFVAYPLGVRYILYTGAFMYVLVDNVPRNRHSPTHTILRHCRMWAASTKLCQSTASQQRTHAPAHLTLCKRGLALVSLPLPQHSLRPPVVLRLGGALHALGTIASCQSIRRTTTRRRSMSLPSILARGRWQTCLS